MPYPALRRFVCLAVLTAGILSASAPAGARTPPLRVVGQVVTVDGEAAGVLVLHVRAKGFSDRVGIGPDGRIFYEFPARIHADTVELIVEAVDRAGARYHPARVRLHRSALRGEQRVMLVPRQWTVGAGRHAGTRVDISLARAFESNCHECSGFFRSGSAPESAEQPGGMPGWPADRFPLRIAFDRARSDQMVTSRDSVAFWRIALEVEGVFGRRLFRPAVYAGTRPTDDEDSGDLILVWAVSSLRSLGRGMTGFHGGDIVTGALWMRSTALLHDTRGSEVIAHELLHTLGFGHTCAWRSVMADTTRCPRQRVPAPSAEDVAYVELAFAVHHLGRERATRWHLDAAHAGERWLLRESAVAGGR